MTTTELPDDYYAAAPLESSRTAAMEYLRRPGPVYRVGGTWLITSYEGVRFAQKHPDLFSSARAFDMVANAIEMIPLAIDPPSTRTIGGCSTRCSGRNASTPWNPTCVRRSVRTSTPSPRSVDATS